MKDQHGGWGRWGGAVVALLLGSAPLRGSELQGLRPALGSRIVLASPHATAAVRQFVQRAGARLRQAECRQVFSDFTDASGVSLQTRLDDMGESAEGYLGAVVFRDGTGTSPCAHGGRAAYTSPGSRVVWVCSDTYLKVAGVDHVMGEALLIHEVLHSLGLGERPPSSEAITAQVLSRCR